MLIYFRNYTLAGFLGIAAGRVNDRFGPRIVMTASGFLLGLGYLLMSQMGTMWQLYLFYGVIVAAGMGASYVPSLSTVSRWFVKRRGLMTGIVAAGMGVGTMMVPPLAGWLISSYDWRTSYVIVGAVSLVLLTIAAQFLRRDPSQMGQFPYGDSGAEAKSLGSQAQGLSLQEAIRTRQFGLLCVAFFCVGVCLHSIMVHIVPHATELRISAASATSILVVIGAVSVAGRLILGSIGDRIGNKAAFIISLILMTVALFWLLGATEVQMLYLFAVIFGFAYGGLVTLQSPIVADMFGLGSHGVIFATALFAGTIGSAVGPVLAGRIFDISGSYHLAFLVCAILGVIGILLTALLRSTARVNP